MECRRVSQIVKPQREEIGVGVNGDIFIGAKSLPHLDPFLTFADCTYPPNTGLPDHPHRGFEVVEYVLHGDMAFDDNLGNKGQLRQGDSRAITIGRGIVHNEYAGNEEVKMLELWVNLRSDLKMCETEHRHVKSSDSTKLTIGGAKGTLIVGEAEGQISQLQTRTPVTYVELTIPPSGRAEAALKKGHAAFVYVLSGAVIVEGTTVNVATMAILGEGDAVRLESASPGSAHCVVIAGKPIGEAIVKGEHEFIMNTQKQAEEAEEDFAKRRNGFEVPCRR